MQFNFAGFKSLIKSANGNMLDESRPKKFGTFGGVFTPNVLTILGVIMYLRLGLGCR